LILKENPQSNLGWRIVLHAYRPEFLQDVIAATIEGDKPLFEAIPPGYRDSILAEVEAFEPPQEKEIPSVEKAAAIEAVPPAVRVTSFEGAKGLSAQHVFIAGLHDEELPGNPNAIKDLEICKFVVGLTRTRKKCVLIHTRHSGTQWKSQCCFISWIAPERLDNIKVDKVYWDRNGMV
jgi:superfamily I DNA/RNA helicase